LRCKLCERYWARLWARSDAWERAHPYVAGGWSAETAPNRELMDRAYDLWGSDPDAAFKLFLEAGEAGSPWALDIVARQYEDGGLVDADAAAAERYYRRAIEAGSWPATIDYARLLDGQGRHGECDEVLEGGVSTGFDPAFFWLARLRYERRPTRKTCREVRPLLEHAAGKGHPLAQAMLFKWMSLGRFGLREIPKGIAMGLRWAARIDREEQEDAERAAAAAAGA
jgi:TPR repeat protein